MSSNLESTLGWSVYTKDSKLEQSWISELRVLQRSAGDALGNRVNSVREQINPLILIDPKNDAWKAWVQNLNREEVTLFLVLDEKDFLPDANYLAKVDDVIVYPFRMAELLSKCKNHHVMKKMKQEQNEAFDEVKQATEVIQKSNEVLNRILTLKTPQRFSGIKGIQVMSRHLSGLKPGGDYFDVFESERRDFVNILLVDSSSYGLSSALLGMILSSSAKMANDASMNAGAWIRAIYQELKVVLGEHEHLSVFFGRLNRRDFSLHYQLYGSVEVFKVGKEGSTQSLEKQGKRIQGVSEPNYQMEKVISLNPKDRLVLLTDGFVNGVGGEFQLQKIFHDKIEQEPFAIVNELAYQIKSKLKPGETFPGEDCSAIVIDIENRVLRLAPTG